MDTQGCIRCLIDKPLTCFYRRSKPYEHLFHGKCKECTAARQKELYHLAAGKQQRRLEMYHMTRDDWTARMQAQDSRCATCLCRFTSIEDVHVDHNHACCPRPGSCGECVRGFLCRLCNNLLGYAKDDPQTLDRAAIYLRAHA